MEKFIIFCDLDGTLYIDGKPFEGIPEILHELDRLGHSLYYTTNNTSFSNEDYYKKLLRLNFPISLNSIISPLSIAKDFFKKSKYKNLYLSASKNVKSEFYEEFYKVDSNSKPDSILITFNKEIDYEELQKISEWINDGIPYFLTHIDITCPTEKGPIPDCGAIGQMLVNTTNKKYIDHFGKPGQHYVDFLKNKMDRRRAIFIGDRLYTDAKIGKKIGAKTVIVLSGETKKASNDKEIIFSETALQFFETIL